MRETKRKIKRNKKRRAIKLFFATLFIALFALTGGYLYRSAVSHGFVSPLPPNYKINSANNESAKHTELLGKKLNEKNIEYDKIIISENSYVIHLSNKSEIFLTRDKDINPQLASLQFILSRLTMEGKGFKSLDLRFDKPIIRE